MILPTQEYSFVTIRGQVASVLLERANNGTAGQHRLAQRDIASALGIEWGMVHMSLKSIQEEGAIRIERHRLIINKVLLQKLAEMAG